MGQSKDDDQYSEQEAEQRFLAALKAAVNTPPRPLKDIPRKWSGVKRKTRRKHPKNASASCASAENDAQRS
jgi:hypothetical protein